MRRRLSHLRRRRPSHQGAPHHHASFSSAGGFELHQFEMRSPLGATGDAVGGGSYAGDGFLSRVRAGSRQRSARQLQSAGKICRTGLLRTRCRVVCASALTLVISSSSERRDHQFVTLHRINKVKIVKSLIYISRSLYQYKRVLYRPLASCEEK